MNEGAELTEKYYVVTVSDDRIILVLYPIRNIGQVILNPL